MADKTLAVENDPSIDDIYQDSRDGEYLQIVYIDDQIAVLRSERTHRNSDRHVHRFSPRHQFDQQVEHDRLEHSPDADVDIPKAEIPAKGVEEGETSRQPAATNGGDGDSENNAQIGAFIQGDGDDDTGQVSGEDDGETSIESVENGTGDDGGNTDESANDHEDWTVVPYVGDEAADNLYDHGIKTADDIDVATDDELAEVPLVADQVISNLRDFVAE